MIERAGDLIENRNIEEACGQLKAANKKMGSFVVGDAVSELRGMIQQVMRNLGCK